MSTIIKQAMKVAALEIKRDELRAKCSAMFHEICRARSECGIKNSYACLDVKDSAIAVVDIPLHEYLAMFPDSRSPQGTQEEEIYVNGVQDEKRKKVCMNYAMKPIGEIGTVKVMAMARTEWIVVPI